MLDAIRSFFDSSMSADQTGEEEQVPDIRLAACALLLELAYADDEFTEDEAAHLKAAIRRQYVVDSTEAEELIRLAEEERKNAVDLYQFTSLIRDNYSLGQKMVLAEIMWGLIYADGEISGDEEYLMRKVCNLLKLEPGYLADLRRRVEGS
jgi:uncharacterized tellurite resistance protein B-like protein